MAAETLRQSRPYRVGKLVITRIVVYFFLLLWTLIVLTPVVWMLLSSVKPIDQILTPRIQFLPREIHLENYAFVWQGINFQRYFFNSLLVAVVTTLSNILISSMAGYGLSKFNFPGRKFILLFILSSIMIPFQIIMIPLFIIVKNIGLMNSIPGLIIPASVSAFGVFLMRQTILPIPNDFGDAARIDGASELQIYFRVILPLARTGVITLGILAFLASWNNLIWPLVVIFSEEMRTLPLALAALLGNEELGIQFDKLMSVAVIMTAPVIVLYAVFSRFVTKGILVGGVKG